MLFFKKKLNWGYIRFFTFVLSLLLFSTHSFAFEGMQHKFYFHLSEAGIDRVDYLDYGNRFNLNEPGTGVGVSYDFVIKNGHAVAVDLFSLTAGEIGSFDDFASSSLRNIGYRYYSNSGLHVGVGYIWGNVETFNVCFVEVEFGVDLGSCKVASSLSGLGLTLGYTHVFDSGFTLGMSSLYVPAVPIKDAFNTNSAEFGAQVISLILGHTWR